MIVDKFQTDLGSGEGPAISIKCVSFWWFIFLKLNSGFFYVVLRPAQAVNTALTRLWFENTTSLLAVGCIVYHIHKKKNIYIYMTE